LTLHPLAATTAASSQILQLFSPALLNFQVAILCFYSYIFADQKSDSKIQGT